MIYLFTQKTQRRHYFIDNRYILCYSYRDINDVFDRVCQAGVYDRKHGVKLHSIYQHHHSMIELPKIKKYRYDCDNNEDKTFILEKYILLEIIDGLFV